MKPEEAIKELRDASDNEVRYGDTEHHYNEVMKRIEAFDMAIKALEQQLKIGHWIADVDRWGDIVTTVNGYRCSECNAFNTDKDSYCPNCGAKMQEEEE